MNRGKLSLTGIAEKAFELNLERVVIIGKFKGELEVQFFHVKHEGLEFVPPLVYLRSVKLRRDFKEKMPRGERIKSIAIVTSSEEDLEDEKFKNFLSNFFEVPLLSLEGVISGKYDAVLQVQTNSLGRKILTFKLAPEFVEVGPRLNISRLVWELKR
jgi:rRNA maturation protein Rpf1